jgi:hypothetical protein
MKIVVLNVFFPKEILLKETIRFIIFYRSNIKGWLGPGSSKERYFGLEIKRKSS